VERGEHRAEIAAFVERLSSGGAPLIPFEQLVNVTKASFAAVEAARSGKVVNL
jgi:predicted dehydrogenase